MPLSCCNSLCLQDIWVTLTLLHASLFRAVPVQIGLLTAIFILFARFLTVCVSDSSQGSAAKAIRTADPADLDSVLEVVRSAMPFNPQ